MCKLKFCGLKSLPHGGANDILVSYMLKQISLVVKWNRARNCLKGIYHLWFRDPHFPPSLPRRGRAISELAKGQRLKLV